nr:hydrogenase maturation protease [Corynebacterium lactis]
MTGTTIDNARHSTPVVTVLGIGNPVMGDDGIGLEILRRLAPSLADAASDTVNPGEAGAPFDDPGNPADSSRLVWTPSGLADPADNRGRGDAWKGSVAYIDGGTCGMELLPIIQEAKNLLLLDALAGPGEPGDVVKLVGDQIPRLLAAKLSAHQVGLLDLLTAARLLGSEPERVGVVGVVYESADMVVGLSHTALGGIDQAVPVARELIDQWLAEAGS